MQIFAVILIFLLQTISAQFNDCLECMIFSAVDEECKQILLKEESELSGEQYLISHEISGAVNAECQRHPYLVSLQHKEVIGMINEQEQYRFLHFCSGTLIAADLVLTAAHCVYKKTPWLVQDLRLTSENQGMLIQDTVFVAHQPCCRHLKGRQRISADRYYLPEEYTGDVKNGDDIIILQLSKPFDYEGPFIQYYSLDMQLSPEPLQQFVTLGYGATSDNEIGIFSERVSYLQQAMLDQMNTTQCNEMVQAGGHQPIHLQKNLCFYNDTADTCLGDSGGPVLFIDQLSSQKTTQQPNQDVQVGITSYGFDKSCGASSFPGVYTNVQFYEEWITDVIQKSKNEHVLMPGYGESQEQTEDTPSQSVPIVVARPSLCYLQPDRGFCDGALPFFYYDTKLNQCQQFLYGGCGGNRNLFGTYQECDKICGQTSNI
eukprot:TRINITY_DN2342_c0_g1_i4.p1 TRINITY_DN2342_c0_g1~~TRINITY_DN2342_c0_g1_i4.p1  ORF type:complete len:431 (-),score=14.71 TRINITY_DN2342_c0_g1_i4:271-1563(-)